MLGPKHANGQVRIWRFEQQPAPNVEHEGTLGLDDSQMIADFIVAGTVAPRRVIRERWTLANGRLEFDLLAGNEDGPFTRVGGFIAVRD